MYDFIYLFIYICKGRGCHTYEKNIEGWGGLVITKLKILRGALQDIRNASRYINGDSKLQNNKHGFKV